MPCEKAVIDDQEIIALYESGYSQNDIVKQFHVSVQRTRSVLQKARFNTRGYRALNDTMKRVILCLVKNGVYYLDIERVTDISFHAIRDFVTKDETKKKLKSRKESPPEPGIPSLKRFPLRDEILKAYESGDSFCSLVSAYSLTDAKILSFYLSLTDESLEKHRRSLYERILQDLSDGLSYGIISRKYWISKSLVKKYSLN